MQQDQGPPEEARIRARLSAGDVDGAATDAIQLYGGEIFGLLLTLHHGDEVAAGEVFSIFCEQLWRGLRGFAWASALRTWAYMVARHASSAHRRAARRLAKRAVPLSECAGVAEAEARVRTETLSLLRTERRNEIALLRQELPEEDQVLLILRVDRNLPWLDLARIFLGDEAATPEALQRESARLRKRFQLIKRRLLELGRERGMIPTRET
jgi:RNA polymerase sigma-70 factor (ECF subfamily)